MRAVQIAQLITQVAAIGARENNSGRYQCFFNRFQPSLMRAEKVEQPNQPKTGFLPIEYETTQTTQPT